MSTKPEDWADPFLEQAKEDLAAARLVQIDIAPSTFCMLMQMVFEKLSKCVYAKQGTLHTKHNIIEKLRRTLEHHSVKEIKEIFHNNPDVWQFVYELEAAQPQVAGKGMPCLEYPWEESSIVKCPAKDHPLVVRVKNPKCKMGPYSLKIASAIVKNIKTIAP